MDRDGWWEVSRIDLEGQLTNFNNILVLSYHGVQKRTLGRIIRTIQPNSRCYRCPNKGAKKALYNHMMKTKDASRLPLFDHLRGQVFLILTNSVCQDILDEIDGVEVDGSPKAHIKPTLIKMYENGHVVDSEPLDFMPLWED